jgi:hypothetical protein
MTYLRFILSAFAAVIVSEVPFLWPAFANSKATGLAVIQSVFLESLYHPLFWILAIALFVIFFGASRSRSEGLRVLLFWIPTLAVSCISLMIGVLITYMTVHFRNIR